MSSAGGPRGPRLPAYQPCYFGYGVGRPRKGAKNQCAAYKKNPKEKGWRTAVVLRETVLQIDMRQEPGGVAARGGDPRAAHGVRIMLQKLLRVRAPGGPGLHHAQPEHLAPSCDAGSPRWRAAPTSPDGAVLHGCVSLSVCLCV
jgi:hypothetical protein